jgi:hypothetical protein
VADKNCPPLGFKEHPQDSSISILLEKYNLPIQPAADPGILFKGGVGKVPLLILVFKGQGGGPTSEK